MDARRRGGDALPMGAVFIDYENVERGVKDEGAELDVGKVRDRLGRETRVVVARAYADWTRFPKGVLQCHKACVEMAEMPSDAGGKNSADIQMVVDALNLAHERPHIEVFGLVSGDSDFVPLVRALQAQGRRVVVMGRKSSTSGRLERAADRFIGYDAVDPASRPSRGRMADRRRDEECGRRSNGHGRSNGSTATGSDPVGVVGDSPFHDRVLEEIKDMAQRKGGPVRISAVKDRMMLVAPEWKDAMESYHHWGTVIDEIERSHRVEVVANHRGDRYVGPAPAPH